MIYSVVLTSAVWQHDSFIHVYIFLGTSLVAQAVKPSAYNVGDPG